MSRLNLGTLIFNFICFVTNSKSDTDTAYHSKHSFRFCYTSYICQTITRLHFLNGITLELYFLIMVDYLELESLLEFQLSDSRKLIFERLLLKLVYLDFAQISVYFVELYLVVAPKISKNESKYRKTIKI